MHRRGRGTAGGRGQSLAEFALLLPVLLLLTLVAIDFGRVYLGWVNLQNMARVAANFAANHPTAWALNDVADKADYQDQILADARAINCTLPTVAGVPTAPDPTFSPDTNLGSNATVQLACSFKVITPLIGGIIGNGGLVQVAASSTFPIKDGAFADGGGSTAAVPVASFTGSPTTITDGGSVAFTDTSTGVPDTWSWTFGDAGTSSLQHPTHAYVLTDPSVAQTFTVTLTASNSLGSHMASRAAYITVNPAPPSVDFTASTTTPTRNQAVTFTGISSGTPTAVAWDFGDGQTSTAGLVVNHAYASAGTYTVTLTVTTSTGSATRTRSNYITVSVGTCTVPSFIGTSTGSGGATTQGTWNAAGFTTTVRFQQGNLPWTINSQTLTGNSTVPCNSTITVSKN